MTRPPHPAAAVQPDGTGDGVPADDDSYPRSVSELARLLKVHRRTLQRALVNDPAAPQPGPPSDLGHPRYDPGPVMKWWPERRRRGRPAPPPASEASDERTPNP